MYVLKTVVVKYTKCIYDDNWNRALRAALLGQGYNRAEQHLGAVTVWRKEISSI